jgi:hypothetical protein
VTEPEWLTCTDPMKMEEFLEERASQRQFRLLACAHCRHVWEMLDDTESKRLVEVSERFADGEATVRDLAVAEGTKPTHITRLAPFRAAVSTAGKDAVTAAFYTYCDVARLLDDRSEYVPHAIAFIRDIFGNPFRPVTFDPAWLTSTVVALAEGIYAERAFDRMPILADALQDAGCDNADVLHHCRGDGPHCRGCWVVDLVLGKE